MKRTLPEDLAQTLERDRFIEMLLNVAADLLGGIRLPIAAGRPRTATKAGAESGFFRLLGPGIKCHVLPPRAACRARWPAIDTSTRDSEDELSIAARVALYNCTPAAVVACVGGAWLGTGWLGRVNARCRHFAQGFFCEYGIRRRSWG